MTGSLTDLIFRLDYLTNVLGCTQKEAERLLKKQ
jgi:hypothetical protein